MTNMVSVCLTCGSDGFPEWLVFCNKCQVYAAHRYCLKGAVIFDDDVTWLCEDCEPKMPLSPENSTPLPCRTSHNRKLEKDTIPAYLKLKNLVKRVKKNYIKRPKIMKKHNELKIISGCLDQPKVELSNCSNSPSHHNQNHFKRTKNSSHEEQKKFMKNQRETAEIFGDVSIILELSPDFHASNHDRIQCSEPFDETQCCSDKEQKKSTKKHNEQKEFMKKEEQMKFMKKHKEEQKEFMKQHKEQKKFTKKHAGTADISGRVSIRPDSSSDCHTSNHDRIQCSEQCGQTQCGDNFEDPANSNKASNSVQKPGAFLSDNLNIFKLDPWADAQPDTQPIWRGSFICNQGISGPVSGLVAHASALACSKVLDETKLFPELLRADVLNRSAVWPKGFKDSGPTIESIALYIFPETERDEKTFDKLVNDIISLDLAIRVEVVNAEFLVFPSTVLPTQYWRFNKKYYLWGVFRSKQASKTN